jgi:hypothetical protein
MKLTYLTIVFFLSIVYSFAQTQVKETNYGKVVLDGSHLKTYSNKWRMYSVDPNGNEVILRIWTDYMSPIMLDERKMLNRVQELYSPKMELQELWTNLFDSETLLPYRASQFKTNGDHSYIEFNNNLIRTSLKYGNDSSFHKEFALNQPVFDWTLYGILLSGLPFEKGLVTTIPIFNQNNPDAVSKLIAKIEKEESIKDDEGNDYATWLISTNVGLEFWLTKKAPYVIQLKMYRPNGSFTVWRIFK